MANANSTSRPHFTERPEAERFVPLGADSQTNANPRYATLYLRTDAPCDELYNAAEDRLSALIELLGTLALVDLNACPVRNILQISRSLLLLASDAHSLYQANHEQRDRRR